MFGRDTRLDVFNHFSRADELRSGATALEQQSLALLQEQSPFAHERQKGEADIVNIHLVTVASSAA
jgi:hypothetical protein